MPTNEGGGLAGSRQGKSGTVPKGLPQAPLANMANSAGTVRLWLPLHSSPWRPINLLDVLTALDGTPGPALRLRNYGYGYGTTVTVTVTVTALVPGCRKALARLLE